MCVFAGLDVCACLMRVQRIEVPDRNFQYVLFAAEPYETIGFKVGNTPRAGLSFDNCCVPRVDL